MSAAPKLGPVIAIDGPAGTGKSSVTKALADRLGFVHVDTGALYRALAHLLISRGEWTDGKSARERAQAFEHARSVHLEFRHVPGLSPKNRIFCNGVDVTSEIRAPQVSAGASAVSAVPEVRAALLGLQRKLGCAGRTILEGRDIGTVVFPDADVKFFLSASSEERARRRLKELEAAGHKGVTLAEVQAQIEARDHADSSRAVAPLKKAVDAVEVDTTALSMEQVISQMEQLVRERLGMGTAR